MLHSMLFSQCAIFPRHAHAHRHIHTHTIYTQNTHAKHTHTCTHAHAHTPHVWILVEMYVISRLKASERRQQWASERRSMRNQILSIGRQILTSLATLYTYPHTRRTRTHAHAQIFCEECSAKTCAITQFGMPPPPVDCLQVQMSQ